MNSIRIFCLICFSCLLNLIYAQSADSLNDSLKQRDLVDIAKRVFKFDTASINARSGDKVGKLYFSFIPAAGYTLLTKLGAVISTNYAFYTEKDHSNNLSVIKFIPLYTTSGQLVLPLKSNIWTPDNKYNIVGDYRYYRYPQVTYGLGGHTSMNNALQLRCDYFSIRQAVHKHITDHLFLGLGYNLDYYWYITEISNNGNGVPDYKKYGADTRAFSSGPSVNILMDNRKNSINPEKGFYGNIVFRPNFTFMGSDHNWQSLIVDLRKYIKLRESSKNVLAFWGYAWLTFGGDPSYLELPSTGWDAYSNLGRGYIQGRFRGRNLLYLESEYRFAITKNGLIGGVVFANAQTVSEWPSNRFEVIAPAAGTGLRIKLNKHSNTNVAIDYGFGLNGYGGLFVCLGEVF